MTYSDPPRSGTKILIAHRGASAYAPEHTLEAYRLAVRQGADFIEPDLQITRDGVLICLHDLTLERTTNVADVFPDRRRESGAGGGGRWHACDFTLAEIKTLDAGSWFGERFRGARIPTLSEAVDVAREGCVGIYPETKAPEVYGALGFSMERLLLSELVRQGLHPSGGDAAGLRAPVPAVIQSFSEASLRILKEDLRVRLPLVLLIAEADSPALESRASLARVSTLVSGIGPAKAILLEKPSIVTWAHEAGLHVVPWTFRSGGSGPFPAVDEEMVHYLYVLGVDGLFTNNPDLFPRRPAA